MSIQDASTLRLKTKHLKLIAKILQSRTNHFRLYFSSLSGFLLNKKSPQDPNALLTIIIKFLPFDLSRMRERINSKNQMVHAINNQTTASFFQC
jgi:hypothetical protein